MSLLALVTLLLGMIVGLLLGLWFGGRQGTGERMVLTSRIRELEEARDEDHDLAMTLAPLTSSLARVERQVEGMEKERTAQVSALATQLKAVHAAGESLRSQTAALAGALNAPTIRGSWGEVQLRRVVEHAGMLAQVDFDTQVTGVNDDGADVRPDAVVRLPGGKQVVIDAKAPMHAFLIAAQRVRQGEDPAEAAQRQRDAAADHARALRRHVDTLAAKRYWSAFTPAPEMVVCFVPGEAFLASACETDPALLEHAMGRKVVLATPSTLLALLRTVASAWQQDALTSNARDLLNVSKELYGRIGGLSDQLNRLGKSLDRSVSDYNAMLGTLERRVLVSARRMHALGLDDAPVHAPTPIESATRPLAAPELVVVEDGAESPAPPHEPPHEPRPVSASANAPVEARDAVHLPGQDVLFG